MPVADCACKVIDGKSGYSRDNTSWVIGRIVRDYEEWMDPKISACLEDMINEKWNNNKAAPVKSQDGDKPNRQDDDLLVGTTQRLSFFST